MMLYINTVFMMSEAPSSTPDTLALPSHLAAAVWRGQHTVMPPSRVWCSGHAALDTELPGGGWPWGSLTEVLQAQAGLGEWRLLGPALRAMAAAGGRVVLVGPPWVPCMPALQSLGLAPDQLVWVATDDMAQRLWATEQALKAPCQSAVLAWLPQARAPQIRRLHAHAAQHAGLLFAFRPVSAAAQPSAAPLRLTLELAEAPHPLLVHLLKRRGPLREAPVQLAYWSEGVWPLLAHAPPVRNLPGLVPNRIPARAPDVALDGPGAPTPAQPPDRTRAAWH
jgi:protein ImuA